MMGSLGLFLHSCEKTVATSMQQRIASMVLVDILTWRGRSHISEWHGPDWQEFQVATAQDPKDDQQSD